MEYKLGIIGGGQMAEAILKGLLDKKFFSPKEIIVSEPVDERRIYLDERYGLSTTDSNIRVVSSSRILLLAVKPQVMGLVLKEISSFLNPKSQVLISIAAGLPISFYEALIPSEMPFIRVMPNTCAFVQHSISAMARNKYVTQEHCKEAERIFSAIGKVIWVEEDYMDAITALSGSGPAYVALFIEGLIEGGVRCGLPRGIAEKLVFNTIEGTIKLFTHTGKNPYEIKAMVTSPGGTTISALEILYKKGFLGVLIEALYKAYVRSKEISQEFGKN